MDPSPALTAQDRGTIWRALLLGVAVLAIAALLVRLDRNLFGRPPPLAFFHVVFWFGTFDAEEAFLALIGMWAIFITTGIALAPILLRDGLAQALMLPCLILLVVTSLIAWVGFWPEFQWYGTKRIKVYAAGSVLLAALCLLCYRAWRREPEGPARRRFPLAMQLWLQTLWIPWPIDD